jgi:CheY-like chemotaxis protein
METVRTPKIRILVVDDDDAVCQMLTLMLSDERYLVEATKSVAEALGAIEQNPFDGYVMDFKLPDGGGTRRGRAGSVDREQGTDHYNLGL